MCAPLPPVFLMIWMRNSIAPVIGASIYSNALNQRQQYYITRLSQDIDATNNMAASAYAQNTFIGKATGKGTFEAEQFSATAMKGRITKRKLPDSLSCHPQLSSVGFTRTVVEVVVDEAGSLEKGVADGGAEEFESTATHVFTDGIGYGRGDGDRLFIRYVIDYALSAGKETDDVVMERAVFINDVTKQLRIHYSTMNFQSILYYSVKMP